MRGRRRAGLLNDSLQIFHDTAGLAGHAVTFELAGGGVQTDLAGQVQHIANLDGLGVIPHGGGGSLCGNCFTHQHAPWGFPRDGHAPGEPVWQDDSCRCFCGENPSR